MVPPDPEAQKQLRSPRTHICGPVVHIFTYSSVFPENVKDYIRTSNVHLHQVKRSNYQLRHQIARILKDRKFFEDRKIFL